MIELPRRSVTRFFIPLIDVLTLLFCIFLLMPVMKGKADGPGSAESGPRPDSGLIAGDPLVTDAAELTRRITRAEQDLERLKTEKIETLQHRLEIRVLEIDAATGKLFYYDRGSRVEISNQANARAMMDRHKRAAGKRELYYLILFPRQVTGFPEQRQMDQYELWLKDVAHGIDNPSAGR
ncbi:MAG TPA: hypothetical protein VKI65_11270 [Gemmataceae bacterium]|nr:hypothetical protein [Gemmataceae bacterium]